MIAGPNYHNHFMIRFSTQGVIYTPLILYGQLGLYRFRIILTRP